MLIKVVTQAVLPAEYFQIFLCVKFGLTCVIQNAALNFKFCLLMEKLSYDTKILSDKAQSDGEPDPCVPQLSSFGNTSPKCGSHPNKEHDSIRVITEFANR